MTYYVTRAIATAASVLFFSFSHTSHSASFDCAKAGNKAEILICGVPELSALDVRLAELYHQARDISSDRNSLRDEQRAWIKERNQCAQVACLRESYQRRIDELALLSNGARGNEASKKNLDANRSANISSINNIIDEQKKSQEIEFRTGTAAFHLKQLIKSEGEISALPRKDLAVLNAAGKVNFLAKKKRIW